MTCKELVELITDYLEGKLEAAETIRFEQHLATCSGCTGYLEQMRQTTRTIGSLDNALLTDEEQQALLTLFHDWKDS